MRANLTVCVYILVMAVVTYLIRMTPFVLFRKKIKSRFIQSLLYYLPYAVLSAMVIPSVFSSTGSVLTAAVGLAVAVILAFAKQSLLVVALGAAGAAFLTGILQNWLG